MLKKDISVFECSGGTCPNNKEENCTLMPMLVNLQNKVDEFLDSITLEDIMKNNGKNKIVDLVFPFLGPLIAPVLKAKSLTIVGF